MTHRAFLVPVLLLVGCAPTGPSDSSPAPAGPAAQILCATAAWDIGDPRPVALDLGLDLSTGELAVGFDRAHAYSNDDPFDFEPEAWTVAAEWTADGDLEVTADGLAIAAQRSERLTGELWLGTLVSDTHGEHPVVCWGDTFVGDHTYDPELGFCVNTDGEQGLDELPVAYLRASGDGQCGSFPGLSLNEDFLGYPILRGVDLRGAHLDGATLFFAHIEDAQWEGADLTGFEFGYATLTGTTDAHTVWPAENCTVQADALSCSR